MHFGTILMQLFQYLSNHKKASRFVNVFESFAFVLILYIFDFSQLHVSLYFNTAILIKSFHIILQMQINIE